MQFDERHTIVDVDLHLLLICRDAQQADFVVEACRNYLCFIVVRFACTTSSVVIDAEAA